MRQILLLLVCCLLSSPFANSAEPTVLFDGTSLAKWDCRDGAWVIESDKSLGCRMETTETKSGKPRTKGMGYLWSKQAYGDFELSFSYKLSNDCNSGVFFRTDPKNPVQGGFEIQLLDDKGTKGATRKPKNSNGAFYDCQAASSSPGKPAGTWNQAVLTVRESKGRVTINGQVCNEFDIDQWVTANKNPDGTPNKFKTALKDLPRSGHIGFQNHGQSVWFKNIKIQTY